MTRKRKIAALALGGLILLSGQAALVGTTASAWATEGALAAPTVSIESGRYVGPQTVTFTGPAGAQIRYTLDGSEPTRTSTLYEEPIRIEESANLTAVAFTSLGESTPVMRGLLIKTAEAPLAQFAVMSDIHLSSQSPALEQKWQQYFDTLARIMPNPDAIISNGDQINDNNYNTAANHKYPRAMLETNLARTGMDETDVLMTFGNHDDRVTRMAAQYPTEWFPSADGYYETEIAGFPAFIVNTETWNSAQGQWLYDRLSTLSAAPETQGQPIFVFGHKPLPNTVWDGAQSSNPGLKSNLNDFPQVVYFSGHSHLNITDERSIHQETFTSVNEGSMSYEETDSAFQAFGNGLAKEHTIPTAQSVVVEVYEDRVEIDRINYAADHGRTYTPEGAWGFQNDPPFSSTGTLAGPSWVIARGATPEETKAQFSYTTANRNQVAPTWTDEQPRVEATDQGLMLMLPQAQDDHYVKNYTLKITDVATGEVVNLLPANGRLAADYVFAPRKATLQVPLQVRKGDKVGQPIDRTLTADRSYEATLVAYDSYGNASPARSLSFVAEMEVKREALDAVAALAAPVVAQIDRVLGDPAGAEATDFQLYIADPVAARQLAASLTSTLEQSYASQGGVDRAVAAAQAQLGELNGHMVPVQRQVLQLMIEGAERALEGAADTPGAAAASLQAEVERAKQVAGTLNLAQADIDATVAEVASALEAFEDASIDRVALVTAVTAAVEQSDTIDRVLGVLTPAVEADYAVFVEDAEGAAQATAELRELVAAAPLGVQHAGVARAAITQDQIDAATAELSTATAALIGRTMAVERAALQDALDTHAALTTEAAASDLPEAQPLVAAHSDALALRSTLNRSQPDIDAAVTVLTAAAAVFAEARDAAGAGSGADGAGGAGAGGADDTNGAGNTDGGEGSGGTSGGTGGGTGTGGGAESGATESLETQNAVGGKLAETGGVAGWGLAAFAALLAVAGGLIMGRRAHRSEN